MIASAAAADRDRRNTDRQVAEALGWSVQPWVGPVSGTTFYNLVDPYGKVHGVYDAHIAFDTEADAWNECPHFSTDIAAAWTLIDHMIASGWQVTLTEQWECCFEQRRGRKVIEYGDTPAAAIAAASLSALAQVGQG